MTAWTQPPSAGGFLIREVGHYLSRTTGTLAAGQHAWPGTVLGKILLGAASTSGAGNAGNGTITMDAVNPVRQGAKVGDYKATCIVAAANGGTFRVEDPDGFVLGDVAVGATFDDKIKFVIGDGAADFIVGDKFTITIAAGSGHFTQLNPAAQNGSEVAAAISFYEVNALATAQPCVAIARSAELIIDELLWPDGITPPQKALALRQLEEQGLFAR